MTETPFIGRIELYHHHHIIRTNMQFRLQLQTQGAAEALLLLE